MQPTSSATDTNFNERARSRNILHLHNPPGHRFAGTGLLACILVLALLPLGARSAAAQSLLLMALAAAALLAVGRAVIAAGFRSTPEDLLRGSGTLALFGLPALVAAQLALQLGPGLGDGPSKEILRSLLMLSGLVTFYLLVRSSLSDAAAVRRAIVCLLVVGTVEAGYALVNLLSGNERLLIYQRWAYPDSATGTLVSRNHFAFLMEMLLPVGAIAIALFAAAPLDGATDRVAHSEQRARRWLVSLTVIAMALALVFSRSRMGIASFVVALATVAVASRMLDPRGSAKESARAAGLRRLTGPALIALVTLAYAVVMGLEPVAERFLHVPQDLERGRWPIWQATLAMAADRPLLGHGWGTFEALLPGYRPEPTGYFFDHAHNEYLQVLAEGGVVGLLLLGWLLFVFARRAVRTLASPLAAEERRVIFWLTVAMVSVLVHSAADFGLRTPGVAFTFVAVAALYSRVTEDPSLLGRRRPASRDEELKDERGIAAEAAPA